MQKILDGVGKKGHEVRSAFADQTMNYVTAALSLVAGLAWNDAIKSAIEFLFPLEKNNILAQFIYAIVLTTVVVILTLVLRRLIGLVKPKE
jgi:uncharacterized membrane protein YidH (DUF202 family)